MIKESHKYKDVKERILKGIDLLADPVRESMGPKGLNVLFENEMGQIFSTNDGVTISKQIESEDPVQDAIIETIRQSALETNRVTGDGTSTSVLLSSIMVKESFKLIEAGMNQMDLKRELLNFKDIIITQLSKDSIKVKNDKDLRNIAMISSNNDEVIAEQVVDIVKVAGLEGMVFLEPNKKSGTEIIKEIGYHIESGMFHPELKTGNKYTANYENVPVFITDKRIYHEEEAETIISTVLDAGYDAVVVVARDFIGKSINTFIANHVEGECKVLMVKDPKCTAEDNSTLQDLAAYTNGNVTSEKVGGLVGNITIDNFTIVDKVYSDPVKTLIVNSKKTKRLRDRVKMVKEELAKDKDDKDLKKRLASLTRGMVTVKVGGSTPIETTENIYRFEDAVSATRAAMEDGYLVGGGVALRNIWKKTVLNADLSPMFKKFCEANIVQLLENGGGHIKSVMEEVDKKGGNYGYNAMTGKVEDLLKAGIVDPYRATAMAVENSISVAAQIISGNHLIVRKQIKDDKETT